MLLPFYDIPLLLCKTVVFNLFQVAELLKHY